MKIYKTTEPFCYLCDNTNKGGDGIALCERHFTEIDNTAREQCTTPQGNKEH